ncbi:hypothetical protein PG989_016188 [Apiospora arundinis]
MGSFVSPPQNCARETKLDYNSVAQTTIVTALSDGQPKVVITGVPTPPVSDQRWSEAEFDDNEQDDTGASVKSTRTNNMGSKDTPERPKSCLKVEIEVLDMQIGVVIEKALLRSCTTMLESLHKTDEENEGKRRHFWLLGTLILKSGQDFYDQDNNIRP